ncbi:nucleoside hydrolase [Antarcticirhabdus aurantiaca]|uniref:Nucleoside hydrolase n=1 Tax=Antarcticirhabdus aurantiaca TaxID=2606717 RepID=A0ACD4NNW6_9HYPH|nr:nucleoside hydrolase [Antarcticirhabdus aurantiaca]WAJ28442.1 nucleoside hydrolase [Jeongeuplla avenae]
MCRHSIIIDTDPGQDDALAILLALAHGDALDVLGITAVCGNISVRSTAANALKVLALAGREDVPVYLGAASPLVGGLVTAEELHGAAIMDGWDLPVSSAAPRPEFAADWLIETVLSKPAGTVTICALGPLTNIALAVAKCPEIACRVRELVLMGGASQGGNMNAVAEFNMFVDPHAAARVFSAPIRKTVVSLDVTSRLLLTEHELGRLTMGSGRLAQQVGKLLNLYRNSLMAGAPRALHDPAVIAWLLMPEIFSGRALNVEIETSPGFAYGQTIVDVNGVTGRPANAFWLTDADKGAFYALIGHALSKI